MALALTALSAMRPSAQSATPLSPVRGKLLVAHRGASAYAPEHTLSAYRLAVDQGADYVEQDLGVTRDGALICLHDSTLARTTDVETKFPNRAPWLAVDFTLAEIKMLDAGSWFEARFAGETIPTFDEAFALMKGRAGLFPELKDPALYRARNIDMPRLVAAALRAHGLDRAGGVRRTPVILQSFHEPTIRDLKARLPEIPRVFLFDSAGAAAFASPEGLTALARWATAIGPHKRVIEADRSIVPRARALGLSVVPWTFRTGQIDGFASVRDEMRFFLDDLGVDGVFTDNPDQFPRGAARLRSPRRMARAAATPPPSAPHGCGRTTTASATPSRSR